MTAGHGVDLLALRCDALADHGEAALRDVLEYFSPDLLYVVREDTDIRVVSRLRRAFDGPVVAANDPAAEPVRTETRGGVTLRFARSIAALEGADPGADYVVCDDLEPRTDAVSLSATLEGCETLARYQSETGETDAEVVNETDAETTFLTGALEASYDHVWHATVDGSDAPVRLPVRGLAPLRRAGAAELARLTCGPNGSVAVTSAPADRFGLRALSGVGPTTAERLRAHGYDSRTAVTDAAIEELRSVPGVGDATAREIACSARALADSRVVRRTDEPVPPATGAESDGAPLFVDIETDGLQPTVIWLIGVYDPDRDAYVDFVDTTPSREDPGRATREFVSWLAAEYDRPSLVAWNGHGFDYQHLERFVARYASEYRDYWREHVRKNDPYDWAVRRDNAVLPGRTNRLEDVAAALGCDRSGPVDAVDGKSLARRVRRLLETASSTNVGSDSATDATEIDWETARAYCEADVRELAAVYDAIADAAPEPDLGDSRDSASSTVNGPNGADAANDAAADDGSGDATTQTGLTDF